MKKLISSLAFGLMATAAFAQQAEKGISFTDEYIVIDMSKACYNTNQFVKCDLNDFGIGLVYTAVGGGTGHYSGTLANMYKQSKLVSTIPIAKVDYSCAYSSYCGTLNNGVISGDTAQTSVTFSSPVNELSFNSTYTSYPRIVYLSTGIPNYLKDSFTGAGNLLRSSYVGVLRNVNGFKNEIAKSHRGHLDRFTKSLTDGIALLDAKDAKGKGIYSVLDWRVQENARLTVVFGSVLNELLTDYDDVARLQTSIKSMRVLVDQLRQSYGWNTGLAGTVSKASSSLIDVVRLELQEIASIKMAAGSTDTELKVYMDLLRITRSLQAKVNASKSGDMKAQREIFDFVELWNSKAFQDEMSRLMNAGPDFKNLIVPKLSMLIYAIESIADLSDQEFIVPDRALLQAK